MVKLYERSVAELMVEAAAQAEYPTSRADLVAWSRSITHRSRPRRFEPT
jgi:hypothetical protein